MIEIKDKKDCAGCTACTEICPKKCIQMKPDEEGDRKDFCIRLSIKIDV